MLILCVSLKETSINEFFEWAIYSSNPILPLCWLCIIGLQINCIFREPELFVSAFPCFILHSWTTCTQPPPTPTHPFTPHTPQPQLHPSRVCHCTSLITSHIGQGCITWANVDSELCRHMTLPAHTEFIFQRGFVIKCLVTFEMTLRRWSLGSVSNFMSNFI